MTNGGVFDREAGKPVHSIGWQSGIDWESDGPTRSVAYDEDMCVAVVESRWRWLLALKRARAHRRLIHS